jgi:predicted Holliday junction resolvase-like endonuclease
LNNKKKIYTGMSLIASAFLGIIIILYVLINTQMQKSNKIEDLQEQVSVLDIEAEVAARKAEELESELGESIYLEKLVKEAKEAYGYEEKNRREGRLWIDRKSKTMIATLGAINGVLPGTRLAVYNYNERIGYVTVATPMDVISYIKPTNLSFDKYERDYFRVVLEE